jgi:hypothetical protein
MCGTKSGTLQIAAMKLCGGSARLQEARQPLQSGNRICLYAVTGIDSLMAAFIVTLRTVSLKVQFTWPAALGTLQTGTYFNKRSQIS